MVYITTATTTTLPLWQGILIQVNAALTGTITVRDAGVTVGIVTNPTVGQQLKYLGFGGTPSLITNASCDLTVSGLQIAR